MRNITPKQERKMKKRILIVTNHSYMFWQFRKELVEALQKEHEVILAMPFVGHEEDFRKMGIECIPVSMNRRGVNPFAEAKLLRDYKRLLQKISPDFVLTYSIKPNIFKFHLLDRCTGDDHTVVIIFPHILKFHIERVQMAGRCIFRLVACHHQKGDINLQGGVGKGAQKL